MCFFAINFYAFLFATYRNKPITTHLLVFVMRFHNFVVKSRLLFFRFTSPDKCFMQAVKARALEVRHRVCFDSKNIVKNPVVEVLNDLSNTENIVVTTNNPNRAIVFEHTLTTPSVIWL